MWNEANPRANTCDDWGTEAISDTEYGLIYNDDGDRPFKCYKSPPALTHLTDQVDVLDGTDVKTLCYCAAHGSDIMHYDTNVGSRAGWREPPAGAPPLLVDGMRRAKWFCDQGIEVLPVIAQRAKDKGLNFIPSVRMNDGHYCQKISHPSESVFISRFHLEHLDCRLGQEHYDGWVAWLCDFSHEIVRRYQLDIIVEVIDRFGELIDGIELDFTRHGIYFPPDDGEKKGHLITEMVQAVRRHLDSAGQARGKRLSLLVRVHPSLPACCWAGLEVGRWLQLGLLDVLTPAPWRAFAWDMPLEPFVDLARKSAHPCKLYAGLESYVPARVDCLPQRPPEAGFNETSQQHWTHTTTAMYEAAAANYEQMGVDGLYVFNLFTRHYPLDREDKALLQRLAASGGSAGQPKCFAVTRAASLGDSPGEPAITYEKQLPARLTSGESVRLQLTVGQDSHRHRPESCSLRLGFTELEDVHEVAVELNSATVLNGDSSYDVTDVEPLEGFLEYELNSLARKVLSIDVNPKRLKPGANDVAVTWTAPQIASQVMLFDVELHVSFNSSTQ